MNHRHTLFKQNPKRLKPDLESIELLNMCDAYSSEEESEDETDDQIIGTYDWSNSYAYEYTITPFYAITHAVRKSFRESASYPRPKNLEERLSYLADNAGTVAAIPIAYTGALVSSVFGLFIGAACDIHTIIQHRIDIKNGIKPENDFSVDISHQERRAEIKPRTSRC